MRKFSFVTVDVFSSRALEGNPVAVFTDARGLSDAEMQAIALETRLSETTFIIPRDEATERADGVMVRIFTVAEELPFAGHPTLGTASVLAHARQVTEVALDLKVGRIPVSFKTAPDGLFGEMTQRDPEFGKIHDVNEIARATGIPLSDLDTSIPIQTVSTGFAFAIVPLRSLATLEKLQIDLAKAYEYLATTDARQLYFITRDTNGEAGFRARMLFYGGEDPATGFGRRMHGGMDGAPRPREVGRAGDRCAGHRNEATKPHLRPREYRWCAGSQRSGRRLLRRGDARRVDAARLRTCVRVVIFQREICHDSLSPVARESPCA